MKKFFGIGLLALLATAYLTSSCSRDDLSGSLLEAKKATFNENFVAEYGQIAPNHDWGFGLDNGARAFTRSMANPAVTDIGQPYDEAWVANYLTTAKEPNSTNIDDNFDNKTWVEGQEERYVVDVPASTTNATLGSWSWGYVVQVVAYGGTEYWKDNVKIEITPEDKTFYDTYIKDAYTYSIDYNSNESKDTFIDLIQAAYQACQNTGRGDWLTISGTWTKSSTTPEQGHTEPATEGYWQQDETFVLHFKIIGTWNGAIGVVATEGLTDGVANNNERTVVVTGTWNITADQRVGSKGRIIIANGGTVNVASGVTLNMVNQARLVVLPGGKLTGAGSVEVNNGNAVGEENYNGGTIDVAKFNNNFGKFYNYGKFLVNEYHAGAKESNFYNHSLVNIHHFGEYDSATANARIFNACQFYVQHNARIRNYEGVMGSALIVDGELMFSSSADGTNDPTYVGLAAGALVQCATLYNNGTSWSGPTSGGYAALNITDKITYLNWEDNPANGGYFANNIYIVADTWDNVPDGKGMQQKTDNGTEYYTQSQANYKMFSIIANSVGNGGVKKATTGSNVVATPDPQFSKGVRGCTPGFSVDEEVPETPPTKRIVLKQAGRVFCEDLGTVSSSDIDYNDVVFDAWLYVERTGDDENTDVFHKAFIQLLAAGGTILIKVADVNVHKAFGYNNDDVMINTYSEGESQIGGAKHAEYGTDFSTLPEKIVITDASYVTGDDGQMNIFYIPITVRTSDNKAVELTSTNSVTGGSTAPLKFMAPLGTPWAAERVKFGKAYPMFRDWVGNKDKTPWSLPSETATFDVNDLPQVAEYAPTDDEIGSATSTVTDPDTSGQGTQEEETPPTFSSVTGTDLNVSPTTLSGSSSITLPAASFNGVEAATVYVYGTGDGEVLVNGVSATTVESSAPRFGFGFTRSATPVVKACQLGPSNLKTTTVRITGYNFKVYKCSMVNETGSYSVSEPSGKGDIIYNTSTILDWGNSGGAITITNDALKNVKVGSTIRAFGIAYAAPYWEVQTFGFNTTGGWNESTKINPKSGTSFTGNGAKEIEFPITSQDQVNMVKGGSIVVQGYNFILKYVTIENPSSSSDDGGDAARATATIDLVTSSISISNNQVTPIVGDKSTAKGYVDRIVAGTSKFVAKIQVNADGDWYFQLGPSGVSGGGIMYKNGQNNNGTEYTVEGTVTSDILRSLQSNVNNGWWSEGMVGAQGDKVTLKELKLTKCLP